MQRQEIQTGGGEARTSLRGYGNGPKNQTREGGIMITEEHRMFNEIRDVVDYLIDTYCPERTFDEVMERVRYMQTDAYQDELARDRDGDARCDAARDGDL